MNNKNLLMVALRYNAMYLDIKKEDIDMASPITPAVYSFTERLMENGFCLSEQLLHALCQVEVGKLADMVAIIEEVREIHLNWTPLVKGWDVPTGESRVDHFITWIANLFGKDANIKGTLLPCGHLIPKGTFPLERYNGCPFCGKPFTLSKEVFKGQGSKLNELRLFTEEDMKNIFSSLLTSPTPLDATEKDTLKMLLGIYDLPEDTQIGMKETIMLIMHQLIEKGEGETAMRYIKTPTDILRFLWYEKTGYVQIIEPSVLERNARRLGHHICPMCDKSLSYEERMKANLKLKYGRKTCKMVSSWMNALPLSATGAAENMNPKRGMWVRFIRALRMAEYAKRKGFEHLAEILDVFYNQNYSTWQGNVDKARIANDPDRALSILQKRPGAFARKLQNFEKMKTLDHHNVKIFTDNIEETALEQVKQLMDVDVFKDCKVRIMPDVHAGAGCVIGFTGDLGDKTGTLIDECMDGYRKAKELVKQLHCIRDIKDSKRLYKSIGTLGGGNHFIEIDKDEAGLYYIVIHTGSRNLGKQVAEIYQKLAIKNQSGWDQLMVQQKELIAEYKATGRKTEIQDAIRALHQSFVMRKPPIPEALCYLQGESRDEYLHDMRICQEWAKINRRVIAHLLIKHLQEQGCIGDSGEMLEKSIFESVHNYIGDDNIIRKGSISARQGEKCIIPLNMRDGSLICIGKGNEDWNFSAPHGAGRRLSRKSAFEQIKMDDFKHSMEGIYSETVNENTKDESVSRIEHSLTKDLYFFAKFLARLSNSGKY